MFPMKLRRPTGFHRQLFDPYPTDRLNFLIGKTVEIFSLYPLHSWSFLSGRRYLQRQINLEWIVKVKYDDSGVSMGRCRPSNPEMKSKGRDLLVF